MLQQLQEVLKGLKWTKYEISAYAALVEKGAMTPAELSQDTDIASGRIYDVLRSLEKRGALIEVGDKPKVYDAQNPRNILYSELTKLEKEIDKALQSAEQAWEKRANSVTNNNAEIWAVRGSRAIVNQLRGLMHPELASLFICDYDLSWLGKRDHKILKKMASEKKDVRIISQAGFTEDLEYLDSLGVSVKIGEDRLAECYILDRNIAIIKVGNPPSGIVVKEKGMVEKTTREFEKDFKACKRVEVKKFVI